MKRLLCLALSALLLAGCAGAAGPSSAPQSGAVPASVPAPSAESAPQPLADYDTAFHFSVDDVISVFVDLHFNRDEYDSMFDQPTLAFLRDMHDEYGMVTTLYCFYESYDGGFDLSQCTDRYASEFAQNASWLRVAFHARAPEDFFSDISVAKTARDYRDMNKALARICGAGSIDPVARLHWWDAGEAQLAALADEGLRGVLAGRRATDGNYHLPEKDVEALFEQDFLPGPDGLFYTPTDLWLEDEADLDDSLAALLEPGAPGAKSGMVVAFTHEYAMGDPDMHAMIEQCAQTAVENGWGFAFPLDFYTERGLV